MDRINTIDHLGKAIHYITNEMKTKGLNYSNSGITSEQITDTFLMTKNRYPSRGKRQAYHYKFSFSKDEKITPEAACQFMKSWVDEYLGEDFDFVCSVHQDRDHMHMHLIFNSVRRSGGKFRYEKSDWEEIIKPLTNCLAARFHTGPLKEKDPTLDYSTDYEKSQNGITWKEKVQLNLDACIKESKSYSEFKQKMIHNFKYQLREGVSKEYGLYLSLTPPGKAKAIRTYRLDPGYMPAEIEAKILGEYKEIPNHYVGQKQTKSRKLDWAMSKNYSFIPYKELSTYQKAMVRQTLDARRMYQRTGTSLQMHEQSVRTLKKLKKETDAYGITIKKKQRTGNRAVQKELDQINHREESKQYDRRTDREHKKNIH